MHPGLKWKQSRIIHCSRFNEYLAPILILIHDILGLDLHSFKLHVILLEVFTTNHFNLIELLFVLLKCSFSLFDHIVNILINEALYSFDLLGHEISQLLLFGIDRVSGHNSDVFNSIGHLLHAFRVVFIQISKSLLEVFLYRGYVGKQIGFQIFKSVRGPGNCLLEAFLENFHILHFTVDFAEDITMLIDVVEVVIDPGWVVIVYPKLLSLVLTNLRSHSGKLLVSMFSICVISVSKLLNVFE